MLPVLVDHRRATARPLTGGKPRASALTNPHPREREPTPSFASKALSMTRESPPASQPPTGYRHSAAARHADGERPISLPDADPPYAAVIDHAGLPDRPRRQSHRARQRPARIGAHPRRPPAPNPGRQLGGATPGAAARATAKCLNSTGRQAPATARCPATQLRHPRSAVLFGLNDLELTFLQVVALLADSLGVQQVLCTFLGCGDECPVTVGFSVVIQSCSSRGFCRCSLWGVPRQ
jgi:hypothetical protein